MNWFTSKVPGSALEARVASGESAAAREYLTRFRNNQPIKLDVVTQALTVLALEDDA
jgi:hypothetical protein